MNYRMVDLYDCGSRLAQGSTANVICKVTVNCGCVLIAPFSLVFEALTAIDGCSLGVRSVSVDDDHRILFSDGLGLIQIGDLGRTFSVVAFGGDTGAFKAHASACRKTKPNRQIKEKKPWPTGRALVREEFTHDVTDMMRNYGYSHGNKSGNLLLCRKHPADDYRIIGVCLDGNIQHKKGYDWVNIR